ncbi:alpha-1,6-mannosyl-glycoprotein 2-beta-N-acetylglucosaminyltransferase-like [Anneissia japonica]|uniref:alpha-1,6-mannosyl-glycoprotein 2-beta-N-acetylglucosaminyltransferase-like n=1 Tax=Anneissia japonica TaxID=1529436 RepID=UPI001425B259|nr:alpha-1,6-mannosyl-glycoprotein 2-beta-N-acetylglucosaminyltransferase-like [Anneissia japonica]
MVPMDVPRAKQLKCNNADHPDKYGHYREVKFVMTKHHWWWKLQHVFTGITSLHNHTGPVLLLEEDHYVSPDFLPVLRQMYGIKQSKCPECDILTIGTYDKSPRYRDRANKVDVLNWQSSKHNMGMSIDRATWQRLQPCAEEFCRFDDYNWDWTLQHISTACLKPPIGVMVPKSPRIFHIGECGIHHKGKCNADDLVKKINNILTTNSEFLFPDNLQMTPKTRPIRSREPKANGGWGDIRDHTLCITYGRTQS